MPQRMTTGKCVFELRPALEWDKGKAVEYLMQQLGVDDPAEVMVHRVCCCWLLALICQSTHACGCMHTCVA